MDELTSNICKNARENETAQLTDWRDRKSYWVTKLKDGNCWMTQNLDYNDPNSTKVSAPSNWTSTDANYRAYYDPGNYYYTTPSNWTQCSTTGTGLSACTGSGWSTSGDAHYHAGNYYSWQSAVNGTGTDSGNASGSICPAGWQLPTSNSTTANGSFGKLTTAYSVTNSNTSILRNSPMHFIPGGGVWSGGLNYAGSDGRYWSSTARNSTLAYNLNFYSGGVDPSNYTGRYRGLSVRCLVQGS